MSIVKLNLINFDKIFNAIFVSVYLVWYLNLIKKRRTF